MNRITLNGKPVFADQLPASHLMRGIQYGDGIFESMRIHRGDICLWPPHAQRLLKGMAYLGLQFSADISATDLPGLIINTCGDWSEARVRLTLVRNPGGLYTPKDDVVQLLAEAMPLTEELYPINDRGWSMGQYPERFPLAGSILSNLKTCNALPYILAARFRKKQSYDEVLLLNQYGRIAEATAWNVFCRKADQLFTPPLTEGCLDGVMRRVVIENAPKLGWTVQEIPLAPDFLAKADSIYLTNAVRGVQWVEWLEGKRYLKKGAEELRELIMRNI